VRCSGPNGAEILHSAQSHHPPTDGAGHAGVRIAVQVAKRCGRRFAVPVQTLHAVAETTRLARAAKRVILGIEVEHYSRPPLLRAKRARWCSRAGRRALVRRRSVSSVKVTVVKLTVVKVGEVASCRVRTATTRTTHGHALASDRVRVP